jgi:hypothetical protein
MVKHDEVAYGKTPEGQLLYDLCFTDLSATYLARKHKLPADRIRAMRATKELAELRLKVKLDRKLDAKKKRR